MIRAILFDIDGTLIASGGAGVRAFGAVARSTFGRAEEVERLKFAGRTDVSIVREFLTGARLDAGDDNVSRFLNDYVFWLDHYLYELPGRVLPGVWDLLRALRSEPAPPLMGLLTGNIRLGAELKLRRYGLWKEFEFGVFSDDHHDRNELARLAWGALPEWLQRDVPGHEVLVIGDTPLDIECARAIGAKCLAVATGGSPPDELRAHRPDWVVRSLLEVDVRELCR